MWTNDNLQGWVNQFTDWRERHINDKQFVLILSFLVGVCTALAACLLKFLVEWIKEFLTENFDSTGSNWLYLVYPVIGILLASLFVRGIVRDDISHGVTKILYAISRKQSGTTCGLPSSRRASPSDSEDRWEPRPPSC